MNAQVTGVVLISAGVGIAAVIVLYGAIAKPGSWLSAFRVPGTKQKYYDRVHAVLKSLWLLVVPLLVVGVILLVRA